MIELAKRQLREIGRKVSDGVALEELLLTQFPDAKIAVIRGYDNFSYEAYTQGAFFDENQARKAMTKIRPNGTLKDTYHIVTGSINDLNEGRILDGRTLRPLDNIDKEVIYCKLKQMLSEQ